MKSTDDQLHVLAKLAVTADRMHANINGAPAGVVELVRSADVREARDVATLTNQLASLVEGLAQTTLDREVAA